MRNISIGLFAFLLLPLSFRTILKDRILRIIAIITLISLLISLGGATPVHEWCHEYLPLFNRFRHPGTLRLFTIFGMLLLSVPAFEQLFHPTGKKIRMAIKMGWAVLFLLLLISGYALSHSGLSKGIFPSFGTTSLNKSGFADLLFIQGAVQLLFIGLFLIFLYKKKTKALAGIMIIQVIAGTWLALPFTFISKISVKTIDQSISAITHRQTSADTIRLLRHSDRIQGPGSPALIIPAFYENGPVVNHDIISPTVTSGYLEFLKDTTRARLTNGMPWAYISRDTVLTETSKINTNHNGEQEQVSLISKTETGIRFRTKTGSAGYLHLFQQYHHRWQATVNGKNTAIRRADLTFMAVPIPAGESEIEIRFQPGRTQYILNYISLFTLTGLLLVVLTLSARLKKQGKTVPGKGAVS